MGIGWGGTLALAGVASAGPSQAAQDSKPSAAVAAQGHQASTRDSYDGPPLLLGGGKKFRVGGYASVGGGYTRLMGRDSGLVSLEGALLLDHRFSLSLTSHRRERRLPLHRRSRPIRVE